MTGIPYVSQNLRFAKIGGHISSIGTGGSVSIPNAYVHDIGMQHIIAMATAAHPGLEGAAGAGPGTGINIFRRQAVTVASGHHA